MGAFVGMVIVFVIFAMFGFSRNFLSIAGFANWMNFASTVGIIAIPVAFPDDRGRAGYFNRRRPSSLCHDAGHQRQPL